MNPVVEQAMRINEAIVAEQPWLFLSQTYPDLDIGDVCELGDVWDRDGDTPEDSYAYWVSDWGEDGETHVPVYIDYQFKVIEYDPDDELQTTVKITGIEFL